MSRASLAARKADEVADWLVDDETIKWLVRPSALSSHPRGAPVIRLRLGLFAVIIADDEPRAGYREDRAAIKVNHSAPTARAASTGL